jgi:hypothetical protein
VPAAEDVQRQIAVAVIDPMQASVPKPSRPAHPAATDGGNA